MMPTRKFSPGATEVTGMEVQDNRLYVRGTIVETLSQREAFISFLYFLKLQKRPCILLAHNAFRYAKPLLSPTKILLFNPSLMT